MNMALDYHATPWTQDADYQGSGGGHWDCFGLQPRKNASRVTLKQHRIPITKKAITLRNRMPVQRMHLLKAGKRRHQHQ